jgi:hypothetical protein
VRRVYDEGTKYSFSFTVYCSCILLTKIVQGIIFYMFLLCTWFNFLGATGDGLVKYRSHDRLSGWYCLCGFTTNSGMTYFSPNHPSFLLWSNLMTLTFFFSSTTARWHLYLPIVSIILAPLPHHFLLFYCYYFYSPARVLRSILATRTVLHIREYSSRDFHECGNAEVTSIRFNDARGEGEGEAEA